MHYEAEKRWKGRKIYQQGNMDWFNFKFSNLNYVKCIANSAENSCFDLMSERVKSEMGIKNTIKPCAWAMAERWLGISKGTLLSMLLAVSNEDWEKQQPRISTITKITTSFPR